MRGRRHLKVMTYFAGPRCLAAPLRPRQAKVGEPVDFLDLVTLDDSFPLQCSYWGPKRAISCVSLCQYS